MVIAEMSQPRAPIFRGLPLAARAYIGTVGGFALAAVLAQTLIEGDRAGFDPALLAIAAVLCAVANLFEVFAPASFSFQPNLIIFFAASLLLPPWAVMTL